MSEYNADADTDSESDLEEGEIRPSKRRKIEDQESDEAEDTKERGNDEDQDRKTMKKRVQEEDGNAVTTIYADNELTEEDIAELQEIENEAQREWIIENWEVLDETSGNSSPESNNMNMLSDTDSDMPGYLSYRQTGLFSNSFR